MGILKSGILGPLKNKTGSVIGRSHRGQNVVTSLYHVSTRAPSDKQLDERYKFGMLNSFLKDIGKLVDVGFKRYAKVKSAGNVAFSYNVEHAFILEEADGVWKLNFPALVYSRGDIETPDGGLVVASYAEAGNDLVVSWEAQQQSVYCRYNDLGSFLLYNATKSCALIRMDACKRSVLTHSVRLPANYIGDVLHCYMNFSSADGKQAGNSVYLGEVVFSENV